MYKIFGSENSPYSIKVRAYFLYKGIPHEWIVRNADSQEEYGKYAKLPIIPAVATPSGEGMQDSTPIIESLEERFLERSLKPSDRVLQFISLLLEDFGDEWGNKWMFHYRWAREVDQREVSQRLAQEMAGGTSGPQVEQMAQMIMKRMSGRGFAIGSNEKTAPLIEQSFKDGIVALDRHLANRQFLLGGRPSMADFGIAPQLYEALIDPTAGQVMREMAPKVVDWCTRMLAPSANGDFESWAALRGTLEPFLQLHVKMYLKWSAANAEALTAGANEMVVELEGGQWWQTVGGPQKYHVKALRELQRKYKQYAGSVELDDILDRCGCRPVLANTGGVAKL